MSISRRRVIGLSAGAVSFAALGGPALTALAETAAAERSLAAFTRGAVPEPGRIAFNAPEVAEDGNSVAVTVSVESPMTEESHVEAVILLAAANPSPEVATFHFTPMSGEARVSTRIRLARSQTVLAVARMNDGSCYVDSRPVAVTLGGCGG